jgi:hypothetical protein
MAKRRVYKIIFTNQGKVFEIYARRVQSGEMYGFVEVEGILFGEKSTLVVDPSEEQLKTEFNGVNRTFIPFNAVVRIDEVEREGKGKILQLAAPEATGASALPSGFKPGPGPGTS